jgi:hypothetical protein
MKTAQLLLLSVIAFGTCRAVPLCPNEEIKRYYPLTNSENLKLCQKIIPIGVLPPSGLPTNEQRARMCATPACVASMKEILTMEPSNCLLVFGSSQINMKEYAEGFEKSCQGAFPVPSPTSAPPVIPAPVTPTPGPSTDCPIDEIIKYKSLANSENLQTCQKTVPIGIIPPSGLPTPVQLEKMCGIPACFKAMEEIVALNPSDCLLAFGSSKINMKAYSSGFADSCMSPSQPTPSPVPTSEIPTPSPVTPTVYPAPTPTPIDGDYPTLTPTDGDYPTPTPTDGDYPTPTPTDGDYPTLTPTDGDYPTPTPTPTGGDYPMPPRSSSTPSVKPAC